MAMFANIFYQSSMCTSAKHWPAKGRNFTSLLPWAHPSPFPWTPGERQQWDLRGRRRRAPQPWGEMPGAEKNSSQRRIKLCQLWSTKLKRQLSHLLLVNSASTQMSLKRGWGNTEEWSMVNLSCYHPLLLPHLRACGSPQATAVPPQNLLLYFLLLTWSTGKTKSVFKRKSVFTKKIRTHASFVKRNVMSMLIWWKSVWLPVVPTLSHIIRFCYDLNSDL